MPEHVAPERRQDLPEHVTTPLLALITTRSLDEDYAHVALAARPSVAAGRVTAARGPPPWWWAPSAASSPSPACRRSATPTSRSPAGRP